MTETRRTGWLLPVTVAAAAVGGVLGAQVWDIEIWPLLLVVGFPILLGTLGALAWANAELDRPPSQAEPPDHHQRSRLQWSPHQSPPPTSPPHEPPWDRRPPLDPTRGPRSDQIQQVAPTQKNWWTETSRPTPRPASDTGPKAQAPPLSSYQAERARHVQCVQCGGFELDLNRDGETYTFRCRDPRCGHTWRWAPGATWPPTVVRRNLAGPQRGQTEHIQG